MCSTCSPASRNAASASSSSPTTSRSATTSPTGPWSCRNGRVVERGDTQKVFGNPLHPYTRTLLAAVPRLNEPWTSAEPVEVCAFHEGGAPDTDLYETEPDHFVACAGLPDCGRTSA